MKYNFYIDKWQAPFSRSKFLFDSSILEANETYEVRDVIGSRIIRYYLRKNTGISILMDGDYPRIFICLGDNLGKTINQLKTLLRCYTIDSLKPFFIKYPYILSLVDEGGFYFRTDNSVYRLAGNNTNYDSEHSLLIMSCGYSERKIKTINDIDTKDNLKQLIGFADHLIYELQHFKIDLNALEKTEEYTKYENSIISPKLKHAMMVGGLFIIKGAVKAAARSLGGDIDIGGDVDFDIPDMDFNGDVDFDVDLDLDLDGSNAAWAAAFNGTDGLSDGHNISFGSQQETLLSQGGGLKLDVTIDKEPGTSNLFSIKSSKGIIHNVSGTANWVKIDGIKYKLPDLKG